MREEKSCGAVVYTRNGGEISFVIIESKEGYYGFPKGHVEEGESELETAWREVFEETSLRVEIRDDFRIEDSYTFMRKGELILKRVVYFLAEFSNQAPVAEESELKSVHLMTFSDALSSLQFESARKILVETNKYLLAQTDFISF